MEIIEKLHEILQEKGFCEEGQVFGPETKLSEDLGADSLDIADILMAVEQAFGVTFEGSLKDIETVGHIVSRIELC